MQLYIVFETGTFGKLARRLYVRKSDAEKFIEGKSPHLFKIEEHSSRSGYASPAELFAAHAFDSNYMIHRFSGLCTSNEEATSLAGAEGLVLMIVPEE